MDKVIAMSDQKKFYINGKYHIRNKVHEDKPWFTAQDIEADPEIQY
jgi:prophage antirepressor-like protein